MEIKLNDVVTSKFNKINIILNENKINTLLGSNDGSIKSILNLICGNEKITEGYIEIGTEKIDLKSGKQEIMKIKKDIFRIDENCNNILFNINVLEDIKFYVKNVDIEKLKELLKSFYLDYDICNKNYTELTNSEIKKISLIIAIMVDSKVLILENPTNNLDYKNTQSLIKQLKKLKRSNINIVLTSYDTDFLLEVSDNVIVINENKIIKVGNKDDVFFDEKLLYDINLKVPNVIKFINKVKELKNIKLGNRDNVNDLIKDIYRYAK